MAGPLRTEAIALRTMRFGEADKILHVFTPEHGMRSVIAKGSRRAKSRFGGRLETPIHMDLELHEGRSEISTITGVSTIRAYPRMRENLDAIDAALHACDAVARLFADGEAHPAVFNLLANHLGQLDDDVTSATLGRQLAFRLKLLIAAGFGPQLGSCVSCGSPGPLVAFSGREGGLLCEDCAHMGFAMPEESAQAIARAISQPLSAAPALAGSPARLVDRAICQLAAEHGGVQLPALRISG